MTIADFDWWLAAVIALALLFDFLNGVNDSGALVATLMSTGAISPRRALAAAAVAELAGPFALGVAVATTIGTGIIQTEAITIAVVLAALAAAVAWNMLAWRLGLPTSSTHALIGGLAGAALAAGGPGTLIFSGLLKVILALLASPILGGFLGYTSLKLAMRLLRGASPGVNRVFKSGQILTAMALAFGHGAMDAQKTMGIVTMALLATGTIPTFTVPLWVTVAAAAFLALGVFAGGWYTIRMLAAKLYRVRPVHGFTAQASSAAVVIAAAILGGPLSVAQVASSAIVGAGAGERISKVRWSVAGNMVIAWLLTIPVTAALAAMTYWLVSYLTANYR